MAAPHEDEYEEELDEFEDYDEFEEELDDEDIDADGEEPIGGDLLGGEACQAVRGLTVSLDCVLRDCGRW